MSRVIHLKADQAHVIATCAKKHADISAIETLLSGGTRVVLKNAIDTATIRKAYGSKVLLGRVRRMPIRLAHG